MTSAMNNVSACDENYMAASASAMKPAPAGTERIDHDTSTEIAVKKSSRTTIDDHDIFGEDGKDGTNIATKHGGELPRDEPKTQTVVGESDQDNATDILRTTNNNVDSHEIFCEDGSIESIFKARTPLLDQFRSQIGLKKERRDNAATITHTTTMD